jgi:hypothetical protein
MKRRCSIVFQYSGPPKIANDSGDFRDKSFGKQNGGHVIYRNRSKHKIYVSEAANMIEFIYLESGEFSLNLLRMKS